MEIKKLPSQEINITLTTLSNEFEVTLSEDYQAEALIEALIGAGELAEKTPEGEKYDYRIYIKGEHKEVELGKTLKYNGIMDGSRIIIVPEVWAG